MRSTGVRILTAAIVAIVLVPTVAMATNGYFTHGVGLRAKGMGGASLAYPQDALAAGTNPAGMAFLGDRLDVGVDLFRPDRGSEVTGNANTPVNMVYDANDEESFFMPELGYRRAMGENLALGLSLYGHGGMNTSYTTPIGLFGTSNAGVDLAQMFIVPSVAVKLNERHAFGLGVNVVWQRFKAEGLENFDNEMMSSAPGSVTNNDYSSSTGFGARIGYMGSLNEMLAFGASYQSRTFMGEFEDYSGLFAEEGGFDIPTNYGVGIALMPTEGLVLAADVTQILYSEINSVANPLLPNLGQDQLGTEDGAGFGWEDVTVFKLGVAYDVMPGLTVRGGYNYGGQPIPASETLFNMIAPGVVEHHVTFGGTYAVSESVELTFAYMHAFENTVEGEDSIIPGPPEQGGMGGGEADLTMSQNSFGLGLGVLF
jgi:long-chain fatty acid transport protein